MGYSVKWVYDNMGITRDMLRHYEKEELLPKNKDSKYRDYNDQDIERIWGIKLLIGIGFSTKEIKMLMNDPEYDFDTAIAKKVEELEKKHDENLLYLQFAKTIKFTGCVPTVTKEGNMKFYDFLKFARDNWNFYDNPHMAPFMKVADMIMSKEENDWNNVETEQVLEMLEHIDEREFVMYGYYKVISDMREMEHSCDTVQRVVRLLHEHMVSSYTEPEFDGKITPNFIGKMAASFIAGDISKLNENNYGKEGCVFIANALAYYGGLKLEDL